MHNLPISIEHAGPNLGLWLDKTHPLICDGTLLQPGSYILRTSHPSG